MQADHRVDRHATSKQELDDLAGIVQRNLRDAALPALSADNRFGLAYEAALLLAKMAIACTGYRVKGQGAHHTTFVALELAMGAPARPTALYFERCRRKRNQLSYDAAGVVSDAEAEELVTQVGQFRQTVHEWITQQHPELV